MPVHNTDIAGIFEEIADFLEIEGANPFRIRAYRNAARTVSGLGSELNDMVADGEDLITEGNQRRFRLCKLTQLHITVWSPSASVEDQDRRAFLHGNLQVEGIAVD